MRRAGGTVDSRRVCHGGVCRAAGVRSQVECLRDSRAVRLFKTGVIVDDSVK